MVVTGLADEARRLACLGAGPGGFAVGEGHEVAVGGAGGVEFAGSFFELLAQVEDGLFEFGDAGLQLAGFVGLPGAAGVEDYRAEDLR